MYGTLTDDDPDHVQFWVALSKGDVNKHSFKKPCYRRKQKGTGDVEPALQPGAGTTVLFQ